MGRHASTNTNAVLNFESTELVPLGNEATIVRKGDRWADGGDILLRSEYTDYSAAFPVNTTTIAFDVKTTGLSVINSAIKLSSGRLVINKGASGLNTAYSDDNGNTWSLISNGLSGAGDELVTVGDRVYAKSTNVTDFSYSFNGSLTWSPKATGLNGVNNIFESSGATNILCTSNANSNVARGSTLSGSSFSLKSTGLSGIYGNFLAASGRQFVFDNTSTATPLAYSDDVANTWTSIFPGVLFVDNIMEPSTGGGRLVLSAGGASGSVRYSDTNGTSWTASTNSIGNVEIIELASNRLICYGGAATNNFAYSDDNGATWTQLTIGLNGINQLLVHSSGRIIARSNTAAETNIAYSDNDGINWVLADTGLTQTAEMIEHLNGMVLLRDDTGSASPNFAYSDTKGLVWKTESTGLLSLHGFINSDVFPILWSDTGSNTLRSFWIDDPTKIYVEFPSISTNFIRVK